MSADTSATVTVRGSANVTAGRGLAERDVDLEGQLGVAFRLLERLMVGATGRVRMMVEDEEDRAAQGGGRPFELISGGFVSYGLGPVEASLLAGYHLPRFATVAGPIGALNLGINF